MGLSKGGGFLKAALFTAGMAIFSLLLTFSLGRWLIGKMTPSPGQVRYISLLIHY